MIGQLPKEAGGNYTTGAAKVVYELSKQHIDDLELFTYSTNTPSKKALVNSVYENQYIGYIISPWAIIGGFLLHPIKFFNEWKHYRNVDHMNPLRLAFYKSNIKKAIKKVNPDIIHIHSIGLVSVARFACEDKKIPIVLTCHGIFYRGETNDVVGHDKYYGNLPLCDYYTGLTKESRLEYREILKIDLNKVTIIPNGVDSSKFYFSPEKREATRSYFNTKPNTIVFITVASLQQRKGQLEFLKYLKNFNEEWEYWLIGQGEDAEMIEKYAHENELDERVKLIGYISSDELYNYYSAADIYAHSSVQEGQALSEIEAYSTGLPIIVNKKIEGTIVGNTIQDAYFIFDYDTKMEEFSAWVMNNRKGTRQSKRSYDWEIIMGMYYKLYNQLIKK